MLLKSILKAYCTVRGVSLLMGDYHCILRKSEPHSCAASSALPLHNYCFGALITWTLIHSEMRSKFKVNGETFSFLQTLLYRAAVNSTVFFFSTALYYLFLRFLRQITPSSNTLRLRSIKRQLLINWHLNFTFINSRSGTRLTCNHSAADGVTESYSL